MVLSVILAAVVIFYTFWVRSLLDRVEDLKACQIYDEFCLEEQYRIKRFNDSVKPVHDDLIRTKEDLEEIKDSLDQLIRELS